MVWYRGHGGKCPPQPQCGRVMGIIEIRGEKKLEVLWREVTDHLGQTDFTEI